MLNLVVIGDAIAVVNRGCQPGLNGRRWRNHKRVCRNDKRSWRCCLSWVCLKGRRLRRCWRSWWWCQYGSRWWRWCRWWWCAAVSHGWKIDEMRCWPCFKERRCCRRRWLEWRGCGCQVGPVLSPVANRVEPGECSTNRRRNDADGRSGSGVQFPHLHRDACSIFLIDDVVEISRRKRRGLWWRKRRGRWWRIRRGPWFHAGVSRQPQWNTAASSR